MAYKPNSRTSSFGPGKTGVMRRTYADKELYPTPACATLALLECWKPRAKRVWECAAGLGHITDVLRGEGFKTVESDVDRRGRKIWKMDFLTTKRKMADCVITNPPFSELQDFIEQIGRLGIEEAALFAPQQALFGKARHKALKESNLYMVVLISRPVPMWRDEQWNPGLFNHVWFVFDAAHRGKDPLVKMIDWKKQL